MRSKIPEIVVYVIIILVGGIVILLPYFPPWKETLSPYVGAFNAIGAALLAAIGIGGIAGHYLTTYFTNKIGKAIQLREKGIVNAYRDRTDMQQTIKEGNDYSPGVILRQKSNREVKILGINLYDFAIVGEPSCKKVATWFDERCEYKFLLLDPDSKYVMERAKDETDEEASNEEINIEYQKQKTDTEKVIKLLKKLKDDGYHISIKKYDIYPTISMIIKNDQELFIGPYLFGIKGVLSPWIQAVNANGFFEKYLNHFNDIWNSKRAKDA